MPIGFTNLLIISVRNPQGEQRDHSLIERAPTPRKELCQCDSLGPVNEGEDFGDIDISQRMHDRVEQVVHENHPDDSSCCLLVLRLCVVRTCSSPAGEDGCHAHESYQVLGTAIEFLREKRGGYTGNEVPASQT